MPLHLELRFKNQPPTAAGNEVQKWAQAEADLFRARKITRALDANWQDTVVKGMIDLGVVDKHAAPEVALTKFFIMFTSKKYLTVVSQAAKYVDWAVKDVRQFLGLKEQCEARTLEGKYIVNSLSQVRDFLKHHMGKLLSRGEYTVQYSDACMAQICNPVYGTCAENLLNRTSDNRQAYVHEFELTRDLATTLGSFLPVIMTVVKLEPAYQPAVEGKPEIVDPAPPPYVDVQDLKHISAMRQHVNLHVSSSREVKAILDILNKKNPVPPAAADTADAATAPADAELQIALATAIGTKAISTSTAARLLSIKSFYLPVYDRRIE